MATAPGTSIRPARHDEIGRLRDIERLAGEPFADAGMPEIAAAEPLAAAVLAQHAADGRLWVAADDSDRPVAYIVIDVLDDAAHVEQVSVDPAWAHHRIGSALIDSVSSWASEHHLVGVTLTTFRHVAWNAPYYRRLGFIETAPRDVGPELQALMEREAAGGLDPDQRVAMRRPLD